MKDIIPAVLAYSKGDFEEQLEKLSFSPKLHIDMMDGKFVSTKSQDITEMEALLNYPDIEFEVHLMVENPKDYIQELVDLGVQKVLIHKETMMDKKKSLEFIAYVKSLGLYCFYVLNPETSIETLSNEELSLLNGLMFMSVHPGIQGQKFIPEVIEKMEFFIEKHPKFQLQIDGGITDKTLNKLLNFSKLLYSVGSFIGESSTPKKQYNCLKAELFS